MATKNSRATANFAGKAEVEVGKGRRVECSFLLVPIESYDVILGMPFLTKAKIILDPSGVKATFNDRATIIRCSATTKSTASAATTTSESDLTEEISVHLCLLKAMREAAKVSAETLQQLQWDETIREKAKTLLSLATIALNKELPDLKKEFPEVFPEKIPIKLPPLRPGLNHTICLDEIRKEEFRNEY